MHLIIKTVDIVSVCLGAIHDLEVYVLGHETVSKFCCSLAFLGRIISDSKLLTHAKALADKAEADFTLLSQFT